MDKISQVKTELLMKQWADMVHECRSSGLTVKDWCVKNGVNIKTYYYRLKRVRNYLCDHKVVDIGAQHISGHHDIVPVPIEPMLNNDINQIKITAENISIELPATVQPQLLKAVLEGLKC